MKALPQEDRRVVGFDIATVEFGWLVWNALVPATWGRAVGSVRSNLAQGRIARVIFAANEGRVILLHGFVKTQKTQQFDLDLARQRQKKIEQ